MSNDSVIEQATAAPGEKRALICGKPVKNSHHPCDREAGHKGKHSYRGE